MAVKTRMTFDDKISALKYFEKNLTKREDGYYTYKEGWSDARVAQRVRSGLAENQIAAWRVNRGMKLAPVPYTKTERPEKKTTPELERRLNDIEQRLANHWIYIKQETKRLEKAILLDESEQSRTLDRVKNLIARMDEYVARLDQIEQTVQELKDGKTSYISFAPKPPAAE